MRGIKFIAGAIIAAVVLSQLSFFVPVQVVKADGTLGTVLPATPDQALSTLGPTLGSKSDGRGKNLYDYYVANFKGTVPATLPSYVGNSDPGKAFKAAYDDAYAEVKSINGAYWGSFINKLIAFYSGNRTDIIAQDGTYDPDTFNSDAKSILDVGNNNIMPTFIDLYAGMKVLSGMMANATWGPAITTAVHADDPATGLVTQLANDLDVTNRTEGGTYGAQSSRIVKPLALEGDLTNGKVTDGTGANIYISSSAFYTDFSALFNDLANAAPATDPTGTDAMHILATVYASAQTIDSTAGTTSTLEAGNGPCGTNAGLDIAKAARQGLCSIALLGTSINSSIVNTAAYILQLMIPLGGARNNPSTAGSFLAAFIPSQIQPVNIIDTLNLPIIATIVNLVIRVLGALVVASLLVVALANILQIQMNTYAIKKAIPAIILGFFLAYGGVFATKVLIEFSNNIASFIMSPGLNGGQVPTIDSLIAASNGLNGTSPDLTDGKGDVDTPKVMQQIIIDVLGFLVGIMMFILGMLFVVRGIIFIALVPLAPLAYFGITFDLFKPIWNRWWKTAQGWLFMNAVASFWLWLMFQMFKLGGTSTATPPPGGGNTANAFGGIIAYVFGVVCMYLAMTTPFKMAGEAKAIMGKIEKGLNTGKDKVVGTAKKYVGEEVKAGLMAHTPYGTAAQAWKDAGDRRQKRLKGAEEGPGAHAARARNKALGDQNAKLGTAVDEKGKLVNKRKDLDDMITTGLKSDGTALSAVERVTAINDLAEVDKTYAKRVSSYDKQAARARKNVTNLRNPENFSLAERLAQGRLEKNKISEQKSEALKKAAHRIEAQADLALAGGTEHEQSSWHQKLSRNRSHASHRLVDDAEVLELESKNATAAAKAHHDINFSKAGNNPDEQKHRSDLSLDSKVYGEVSKKQAEKIEGKGIAAYVADNPVVITTDDEFEKGAHKQRAKELGSLIAGDLSKRQLADIKGMDDASTKSTDIYRAIYNAGKQGVDKDGNAIGKIGVELGARLDDKHEAVQEKIADIQYLYKQAIESSSSNVSSVAEAADKLHKITGDAAFGLLAASKDKQDVDDMRNAMKADPAGKLALQALTTIMRKPTDIYKNP